MCGRQQPTPHDQLDQFDVRIIVAGTRDYDNYRFFSQCIFDYLNTYLKRKGIDPLKNRVVFITGKAKTGADDMIIEWCKEFGWPWAEFPAYWERLDEEGAVIKINGTGARYNARAGFQRNTRMAKIGTHLLTFYDGVSRGTRDMITTAERYGLDVSNLIVDVVKSSRTQPWQRTEPVHKPLS